MPKIIDPDSLNQGTEIVISYGTKTIELLTAGTLDNTSPGSTSGVTLQALYSFLKEEWKTDNSLNKFKFPLKMFTKTDGTFINGWGFENSDSRDLVRDAGWTEGANAYAGIQSLGNFDSNDDQAYFSNVVGYDQTVTNFNKTGNLNEAILITGYTGYLKKFLRIVGKIYSEYNLLTEQTISALEPVLYKFPLANSLDLKITIDDATIDSSAEPYVGMKINYLAGTGFTTAAATSYLAGAVVKDGAGRWAFCTTGGTVVTPAGPYASFGGTSIWEAYDGEEEIGTAYYAFNRIIEANNATDLEVYNWSQRQLRKSDSINADDSATVGQRSGRVTKGNLAELLVEYVGDTLKTQGGLLIRGFNTNSTNNIRFRQIVEGTGGVSPTTFLPLATTAEVNFPFVSTGNLEFSSNLVSEPDADTKFTMYFDNAGGNLFDSANAITVKDNSLNDITGVITSGTIAFDFDYDNNTQGGRTAGTDASVSVVAQGLNGATWVLAAYTISRAAGQTIPVNAEDERNYGNPV
jgi:hypothetical protein